VRRLYLLNSLPLRVDAQEGVKVLKKIDFFLARPAAAWHGAAGHGEAGDFLETCRL
jgi:hypothetical protein